MSQEDTNHYILIPQGAVLPSAKSVLENCVPRNMKLATDVNSEDDRWNWISLDAVKNEDNQLSIEVIKKSSDLIPDIFDVYINDILEDMPQQRAKKWIQNQLEDYEYILWFNLSSEHTDPFWKMTQRAMDYICKHTGARLLVNSIGFLTEKGTYITLPEYSMTRDMHLMRATLREDGRWMHWSSKLTNEIATEAFLTEDVERASKFYCDNPDKMKIYYY